MVRMDRGDIYIYISTNYFSVTLTSQRCEKYNIYNSDLVTSNSLNLDDENVNFDEKELAKNVKKDSSNLVVS